MFIHPDLDTIFLLFFQGYLLLPAKRTTHKLFRDRRYQKELGFTLGKTNSNGSSKFLNQFELDQSGQISFYLVFTSHVIKTN